MSDTTLTEGAHIGAMLSKLLTDCGVLNDVGFSTDCLTFYLKSKALEGYFVTYHNNTISLLCPDKTYWPTAQESYLYAWLFALAKETGALVALASWESNGAIVTDPNGACEEVSEELKEHLAGKYVFLETDSVN